MLHGGISLEFTVVLTQQTGWGLLVPAGRRKQSLPSPPLALFIVTIYQWGGVFAQG